MSLRNTVCVCREITLSASTFQLVLSCVAVSQRPQCALFTICCIGGRSIVFSRMVCFYFNLYAQTWGVWGNLSHKCIIYDVFLDTSNGKRAFGLITGHASLKRTDGGGIFICRPCYDECSHCHSALSSVERQFVHMPFWDADSSERVVHLQLCVVVKRARVIDSRAGLWFVFCPFHSKAAKI